MKLDVVFLLAPPLVYFAATFAGGLNLGIRHLMPVYPFLYVLAGGAAVLLSSVSNNHARLVTVAVIVAIAMNSMVVFPFGVKPAVVPPDFLTYFNELAGGPDNGYKSLLDSNLEYGQSLKYLAKWLHDRHISDRIYLCYVGGDDPAWERINHVQVTGGDCLESTMDMDEIKAPGYLAISITKLVGLNQSPKLTRKWNEFVQSRCKLIGVVDHCIRVFQIYR